VGVSPVPYAGEAALLPNMNLHALSLLCEKDYLRGSALLRSTLRSKKCEPE
jgi:hypothetical protein